MKTIPENTMGYVEVEVYDETAASQDGNGLWPTKKIHVLKAWLDEYVKSSTRYGTADELLYNYTLDEVDGLESKAREASAIKCADSCVSHHGNKCSRNGYPPFDCPRCSSYKNKHDASPSKEQIAAEKAQGQIRDEAVRSVMARNNLTNNDVNRYITDAVIEKALQDEKAEMRQILTVDVYTKGTRELTASDFVLEPDSGDWGEDGWSYYLTMTSNVDEIFGTNVETSKNDDYINVYAGVSQGYDSVDDVLIITLFKGNGDEEYLRYKLSESEKDAILARVIGCELRRLETLITAKYAKLGIPVPKIGGAE